jgi:hypothetical protein
LYLAENTASPCNGPAGAKAVMGTAAVFSRKEDMNVQSGQDEEIHKAVYIYLPVAFKKMLN